MIRNFIITVGIIAAVGMINTTPAQASMCDNHGTGAGQIYKHACAKGGGGGGSSMMVKDPNTGVMKKVKHQDAILRPDSLFTP